MRLRLSAAGRASQAGPTQPPATFRLITGGPQLRHSPAAAVGDVNPDHAAGGPDRGRLPLRARAAVPDAVAEQLTSSAASSPHGCPGPSTPAWPSSRSPAPPWSSTHPPSRPAPRPGENHPGRRRAQCVAASVTRSRPHYCRPSGHHRDPRRSHRTRGAGGTGRRRDADRRRGRASHGKRRDQALLPTTGYAADRRRDRRMTSRLPGGKVDVLAGRRGQRCDARLGAARQAGKHAASAARPWPSAEKPTVRTDRPDGHGTAGPLCVREHRNASTHGDAPRYTT